MDGPKTTTTLDGASEADLLGVMAADSKDPKAARAAWSELYTRHVRYVFAVVSRTFGRVLGEDTTTDVVADTFHQAFQWARRQRSPESVVGRFTDPNRDVTRRRVLGWLSRVAERLVHDRLRRRASTAAEMAVFIEHCRNKQDVPSEGASQQALHLVEAALRGLSEGELDALRVSLLWYDSDRGEFAIPRGEAAEIAQSLGITVDTFRMRRYRAMKRIEANLKKLGFGPEGEMGS